MDYLAKIIQQIDLQKLSLSDTVCLVPDYQVGQQVIQLIAKRQHQVTWAPTILTLPDWLQKLSGCLIPDRLQLLSHLYHVVKEFDTSPSFLDFMPWGTILLNDCKKLDEELVDVTNLFDELPSRHKQRKQAKVSALLQSFHKDWQLFPAIYTNYRKRLTTQKMGYSSLLARQVYDQWQHVQASYTGGAIIGINLHPIPLVCQKILHLISKQVTVDCYYDVDAHYMTNEQHSAGYHLRRYQKDSLLGHHLSAPYPCLVTPSSPTIKVIAAATPLEQIEKLNTILQELIDKKELTQQLHEVVIVLGDDNLLLPLLHALPATLTPIALLTGYPTTSTSLYGLCQSALLLYYSKGEKGPNHARLCRKAAEYPNMLLDEDQVSTWVNTLPTTTPWHFLGAFLSEMEDRAKSIGQLSQWEQVTSQHIRSWCQQCTLLPEQNLLSEEQALQFFKKETQHRHMPLANQTKGLKITRFTSSISVRARWVFVLGVEEGSIPPRLPSSSSLPRTWREKSGYPAVEAEEATYAYLFYRLLHNSHHLYFFYATSANDRSVQEKSRYLSQLMHASPFIVKEQKSKPSSIQLSRHISPTIPKNELVKKKLAKFLTSHPNHAPLTPSALNVYLDCPLCFYFQYVASIPPAPIKADFTTIDPLLFGQILHQIMEELYQPYVNSTIHTASIRQLQAAIRPTIQQVIVQFAQDTAHIHHFLEHITTKIVQKIIDLDRAYTPFTLLDTEVGKQGELRAYLSLDDDREVAIGGVIDRIDRKGNHIRLIDYKSGSWQPYISHMNDLFDSTSPIRNKIAMQLMTYCWLYKSQYKSLEQNVMPMVLSSRTLFAPAPDGRFWWKGKKEKAVPIKNFTPYQSSFLASLRKVVQELFDPDIPFRATSSPSHSQLCRYPALCQGQGV
ncbi:MAG: PD-(D/E)XK nuclease family protein [Bacteroidota bacterium]